VQRTPVPQTVQPLPRPAAAPVASATASPLPEVAPVQPQIAASPAAASVPAQPSAPQPWIWALIGAGATAAIGLAGWLLLRRRRPEEESVVPEASAPTPPPPPAPPVRGPSPARVAPPTAPASADPFNIAVQPLRIHIGERELVIEIELLISNATDAAADGVRLAVAPISASPRQDAEIAAFHAGSQLVPSTAPFDLPVAQGGRMPVRLSLPRDAVHVVDVGGRPMFVPIVAIDLRWRAGLSVRRFATSFMLGAAGQGGKLGPIWLDRGQPRGPFAASRYAARTAAAA
jgi:hypothetical protein